MRISRLLISALLALAPSLTLAQGAPAPIRLPKGSTGPADGLTVGGTAIPAILGSLAPRANPTFTGIANAPALRLNGADGSTPLILFGGPGSLSWSNTSQNSYLWNSNSTLYFGTNTSNDLILGTNNSERARIKSTGEALFQGPVAAQSYTGDASSMTATPSATAALGSIARTAYTVGQSVYYMPPPSGSAATDVANFITAQNTGARNIVFAAAPDSNPYLVPPGAFPEFRSNQNITGQGPGKTILRMSGPGTYIEGMVYALEKSDFTISDLTLDYYNYAAPVTFAGTLKLKKTRNVLVENVDIKNFPRFGLAVDGGSHLTYRGGTITRSSTPKDTAGAPIPIGAQNQCVAVSSASGMAQNFLFEDVTCIGSAFNTSGTDFTYNRTNVIGFDFGFAYVTEQDVVNSKRNYFLNVKASGGRTDPATGQDVNSTAAGCLEIWSANSVVDNALCDDLGGNGVDIGGKNSRVTNSRFTRIGMQRPSTGIKVRYESNGFSGSGSLIANNVVVNSNGSGDGSNLVTGYDRQTQASDLIVTIAGNDFGNIPLTTKGPAERWSAPGMLVTRTTTNGYTHPGGTRQSPTDLGVTGVSRTKDAVLGASFKANDGSPLPSNLRLFATVDQDNSVRWYIETISGTADTPVPAGTYSARIITVN